MWPPSDFKLEFSMGSGWSDHFGHFEVITDFVLKQGVPLGFPYGSLIHSEIGNFVING